MTRSFVTGGTRGIGLAIARELLGQGGRVMITGRSAAGVDRALEELGRGATGGEVVGRVADVADRAAVDDAVTAAVSAFGGLDVVVNNAGVGVFKPVEALTDEDWQRVFDTNVRGPFHVTRAAIPVLRHAGGGWIINIASLAGANPFAGGGAYCASKAALIAFSESVMQEVRHDKIRVSVILPGSVATEFSSKVGADTSWKLAAEDVAEVVMDLLRFPGRSLPSKIEIRPSQPRKA